MIVIVIYRQGSAGWRSAWYTRYRGSWMLRHRRIGTGVALRAIRRCGGQLRQWSDDYAVWVIEGVGDDDMLLVRAAGGLACR